MIAQTAAPFCLFDMDGTLLHLGWDDPDLVRQRRRVRDVLAELQLDPPHGLMVNALAEAGRARPDVAELLHRVEAAAARHARPCPGAAALLAHLDQRRAPWAIVTSNGRPCAEQALSRAGLPAGVLVCREDVPRPKPDPAALLRAVALLADRHGEPAEVLMIGDAATDMVAAHAAAARTGLRVRPIGVCGGVSTAAALRAAGAVRVLDRLPEPAGEEPVYNLILRGLNEPP